MGVQVKKYGRGVRCAGKKVCAKGTGADAVVGVRVVGKGGRIDLREELRYAYIPLGVYRLVR